MSKEENSGKYAVGIDLGTTYSCVAVWREEYQRVDIIPNEQGNRITPSCVAFNNGRWLVGETAVNQANLNLTNTIYDAKRIIGRKYSDPTVQNDLKMWPFKVIGNENDNPIIAVTANGEEKYLRAEEISAMVLKKMCEYAETYLNSPVKDVVITVPTYFNDSQRQATRNAGDIAGLNVLQIINEPGAAALAYGTDKRENCVGEINILVFDLGGGSFDVSLVNVKDGVYEVKATAGNNHLGGEDFVNNMMRHFIQEFKSIHGEDVSGDPKAMRKLRTACEKAKRVLSINAEATIEIEPLFKGIDFYSDITRGKLEELNNEFFEECMEIVKRCIEDGKIDKSSVHDVVLVGGSSRIPKLQQMLRDFFNGKELYKSINPDEAVAYGAAVHSAMLSESITKGPVMVLVDVEPKVEGDTMNVSVDEKTQMIEEVVGDIMNVSRDENTDMIVIDEGRSLPDQEITGLVQECRVYEEVDKNIFLEKAIAINDLDKYVHNMVAAINDENISANFSSQEKEGICSAIHKARELLDGIGKKDRQETGVVRDCFEELKSIYEPIKCKIG